MRTFIGLAALLCLGLLASCGGGARPTTGSATFRVIWPPSRLIPLASASIRVDIKNGSTVVASQVTARPAQGGQASATFFVLPTGDLTATASAVPDANGTGTAQAMASVPLKISAGQTTVFSITMVSTIDHLEIQSASQSVVQGQALALSVVAKDAAGNIVLLADSNVTWTSNRTAVATVAQTGVSVTASGISAGTAQISVTEKESNKSTSVSLTVTPTNAAYTIIPLTNLSASEANGINDNGDVVGDYPPHAENADQSPHAFLWSGGQFTDLGTLPGDNQSVALGINSGGVVVGSSGNHAFRWDPGARVMEDLGNLGGVNPGAAAYAVNQAGQIVGRSSSPSTSGSVPFLWQNGVMTPLPFLDPSPLQDGWALAINNVGQVVGWERRASGFDTAFLYDARSAVITSLGTLGGPNSMANGINNNGVVAGQSDLRDATGALPHMHAFLWQNNQMTDLGVRGSDHDSTAAAINDKGQVVGRSTEIVVTPGGSTNKIGHAVLWENGTVKDLTALLPPGSGWNLSSASAINNQGMIVGSGTYSGYNGARVAYLMIPK